MKLSIALAVKNEEQNLEACLQSIHDIADEIVIVDGGSTDRTVEIAKKFRAKIIYTENPPIFHINKQKALDACHGEWILQLDADEIVTEELKEEIVSIISKAKPTSRVVEDHKTKLSRNNKKESKANNYSLYYGYNIPRRNYFLGHWMKKGGQYPDYVIRLFKNGYGSFPCKSVHEQIIINGDVGYLYNPLIHYTYHSVREYWKKANTYINLAVEELSKVDNSIILAIEYLFIKPIITFFSLFIRHKGFIDHIYGFLFALFSSLHFPITYIRYIQHL